MIGTRIWMTLAASATGAVIFAGCASEPKSSPMRGNVAQPKIDDMLTSGERAAEALAADLQRMINEDFGGRRVLLVLGDIDNRTGTVSTNEFDMLATRMRTNLRQSKTFRDNVMIVEKRARQAALSQRERGGDSDPFAGGGAVRGGAEQVDPAFVFFLNGTAFRTPRAAESHFYINFELMRESNGEIVFANGYDIRY